MKTMDKVLATDPETKNRYKKATNGGKEWFCFSQWVAEDVTRWNNAEAVEYRDALAAWLVSTDIAYVLQYETNPDVIAYLKERLVAAVERETTPERIAKRADRLANARKRWREFMESVHNEPSNHGLAANMMASSYAETFAYLRGESKGASYWSHPDYGKYCEWYNKYVAPKCGLVARSGIEPLTHGFSVRCSTN